MFEYIFFLVEVRPLSQGELPKLLFPKQALHSSIHLVGPNFSIQVFDNVFLFYDLEK